MKSIAAIAIASALAPGYAQVPGKQNPQAHPQLSTSECTIAGGCITSINSIVIDSNWMWTHEKGTSKNW